MLCCYLIVVHLSLLEYKIGQREDKMPKRIPVRQKKRIGQDYMDDRDESDEDAIIHLKETNPFSWQVWISTFPINVQVHYSNCSSSSMWSCHA